MVRKKNTKADLIRKYIANNPNAKPREIAEAIGIPSVYVQQIRYNDKKAALGKQPKTETPEYTTVALIVDPVNHPPHYKSGGIETIDFIEAKGLGYHLGNVVKYISRAGLKGTNTGLEDLKKARWYLDRAIEKNEVARPTA